jgi:sec-independent protein translocase protein TatB
MLNLDPGKLLVIAVVAVILLGPDKLPQVARQVGAAWHSFSEFRQRMETEVRSSIPDLPSSSEIARLARSPQALLTHLSNMGTDGTATTDPSAVETSAEPSTAADADSAATNTPNVTIESSTEPSPFESTAPATTPMPHQSDASPVIAAGDPGLN